MILRTSLHSDKVEWRPIITMNRDCEGRIPHNDLEKLIGALPLTQTSVFCRFGRSLLRSRRDALRENPFSGKLSEDVRDRSPCRDTPRRESVTRIVEIKPHRIEWAIYADAANSTRIAAALVVRASDFHSGRSRNKVRLGTSVGEWDTALLSTAYIYGGEMLAILGIVLVLRWRGGGT